MKTTSRVWNGLAVILILGALIRLVLLIHFQGEPLHIVDERQYNEIAATLAQTGNFATSSGELTSIRPPLFIWLTAGVYRLLGADDPDWVFTTIRGIQVILSLLTVALTYLLTRRLFGDYLPAAIAAGAFCFYPSLVAFNYMILTETLFTFWLAASVYFAVCLLQFNEQNESGATIVLLPPDSPSSGAGSWGRLIAISLLCGVCLGLGALTRSILWLAVPCLSLYLFLFFPGSGWMKRSVCAVLVFASGFGIIAPWAVRNSRLQETVTIVDCMSGRNLMMGNYEYTPMYRAWDAISMAPPQDWVTVLCGYTHPFNSLTQGKKDKIAARYAKEFIASHPGLTAQRFAMKALCFWQLERSLPAAVRQGWYGASPAGAAAFTILVWGCFVLVFVSGIAGAFLSLMSGRGVPGWRVGLLLMCVIALFWGVHALVFAHSRYHLPVVFILCAYSGFFWSQVILVWNGKSQAETRDKSQTGAIEIGSTVLAQYWPLFWSLIWTGVACLPFVLFWGLEIAWMLDV